MFSLTNWEEGSRTPFVILENIYDTVDNLNKSLCKIFAIASLKQRTDIWFTLWESPLVQCGGLKPQDPSNFTFSGASCLNSLAAASQRGCDPDCTVYMYAEGSGGSTLLILRYRKKTRMCMSQMNIFKELSNLKYALGKRQKGHAGSRMRGGLFANKFKTKNVSRCESHIIAYECVVKWRNISSFPVGIFESETRPKKNRAERAPADEEGGKITSYVLIYAILGTIRTRCTLFCRLLRISRKVCINNCREGCGWRTTSGVEEGIRVSVETHPKYTSLCVRSFHSPLLSTSLLLSATLCPQCLSNQIRSACACVRVWRRAACNNSRFSNKWCRNRASSQRCGYQVAVRSGRTLTNYSRVGYHTPADRCSCPQARQNALCMCTRMLCASVQVGVCVCVRVCAKTYTYNIYTFCNRARTSIGIAPHRRLHEYVTWRRIFIAQDNANRLRPLVLADYSFMSAWCCCIALFGRCFVHTLTHVGALTYHKSLGGWHTLSAPPACDSRAAGVNAYASIYTHTCIHASSTPISRASSSHTCAYL